MYTSRKYESYFCANKNYYVSVIIPVVDENEDLFSDVLSRITAQDPDEVVIVINGPENPRLKEISEHYASISRCSFSVIHTPVPGKRNAIRIEVETLSPESDITLLVDSDAVWDDNVIENILMPFSFDENIGGVTTRQKILDPKRNSVSVVASILEDIRAEGTMKSMSAYDKVGCLPGRTIAFRTSILRECMDEFMNEKFMGIHKEVSDDRSLTNLTLKRGYKTVMQDTAVVYTDCPLEWKKYFRQQLRWAEGSQYNNIRMFPWMLKNSKLMLFIFGSDMLMPFLLFATIINSLICFAARKAGYPIYAVPNAQPFNISIFLMYIGSALTFSVRNLKLIKENGKSIIFMFPVLVVFLTLFMAPIKIIGLSRCADNLSWGTRNLGKKEEKLSDSPDKHLSRYQIIVRVSVVVLLFVFVAVSFLTEYFL